MINKFIIIGLFLLQFSHSVYAACCVAQYSDIDGVIVDSPAQLQDGKLNYTIGSALIDDKDKDSLTNYNRTKKFIKTCQSHGTFYVDAYGKTPFKCDIDVVGEIDLSAEGGNAFTLTPIKPIDPKLQNLKGEQYGMDLHIISTKPLKNKKIEFSNLKGKELIYYVKLTEDKIKKIKPPEGYLKANKLKNHIFRSNESYQMLPKKYHQNGFEFIFIPSHTIEFEQGLDLVSAVFIKNKQGKVNYLGELSGCIVRPTADLNYDGFTELLTAECEPGEGAWSSIDKVYPKIKSLVYWHSS